MIDGFESTAIDGIEIVYFEHGRQNEFPNGQYEISLGSRPGRSLSKVSILSRERSTHWNNHKKNYELDYITYTKLIFVAILEVVGRTTEALGRLFFAHHDYSDSIIQNGCYI